MNEQHELPELPDPPFCTDYKCECPFDYDEEPCVICPIENIRELLFAREMLFRKRDDFLNELDD